MRLVVAILVGVVAVAVGALLLGDSRSEREPQDAAGAGPVAREARPTQLGRPDADDYQAGSPRRAAEAFLAAWHDRAWERAVHWAAPLWRRGFEEPADALRFRLGGHELQGSFQRELSSTGEGEAELEVLLAVSEPGSDEIKRRPVKLELREEPGRWSVEPSSIPSTRRNG